MGSRSAVPTGVLGSLSKARGAVAAIDSICGALCNLHGWSGGSAYATASLAKHVLNELVGQLETIASDDGVVVTPTAPKEIH